MLTAPTVEKLHQLGLVAMAAAWTEQQQHAEMASLAFDERLGLLVDAQWLARENKRLARALTEAKLKVPHAYLEALDYLARRELDKAVIRQLACSRAGLLSRLLWVQQWRRRQARGEERNLGKPAIFNLLGFTHISAKSREGKFLLAGKRCGNGCGPSCGR